MTAGQVLSIDPNALHRLAALLLDRAGLKITPDGYHGLKLALTARMPALGISDSNEYVSRLTSMAGEHELRALLPLVTVGKTDFFRDSKQFQALERRLLPGILDEVRKTGRRSLIWSAGCATGEEPYSLAMVLKEIGCQPGEITVLATDLNPAAVEFARTGRYPQRRMSGVSPDRLLKHFRTVGESFEVVPEVRAYVHFDGLNLAAPVFPGVQRQSMDLILCRNVIIYFDVPTIRGVMDRFLDALRLGATLLLGYSESLFKVYDKFEMFEIEGAFAYRRPLPQKAIPGDRPAGPRAETGVFKVPLERDPKKSARPSAPPSRPKTGEMPAARPPSTPALRPPAVESRESRLDGVVKLIEAGEFDKGLNATKKIVNDDPNDLAALLTLGNLHSLMGRNQEARDAFAQALVREPLCVEARVFGGIAALQAGELGDARNEFQKALFLEPTLALGHYLLARVQEQMKDQEGARRSYRNVSAQLRFPQRELAGHYPELPDTPDAIGRAARYALASLEER